MVVVDLNINIADPEGNRIDEAICGGSTGHSTGGHVWLIHPAPHTMGAVQL